MRSLSNLEIVVGLLALLLSTIAFLVNAHSIAVLALVLGAVGFGILVGRPPPDECRSSKPPRHGA